MKDIYELLNDVDINENEMEEMMVSDLEKEKVKANLRKSLKNSRKIKNSWKFAIAASLLIVGSVITIGVTNPAYAADIPVIGDIFKFLNDGKTDIYDKYKENSNEINMTQECNGVAVTIKDAIFDGQTLIYTYEIKSDKDLGEKPFISTGGPILTIDGYKGGTAGGSITEKVGKNTYIGQDNYTLYNKEMDGVNFKINIREISDMAGKEGENKSVKGNWDFDISLKAVDKEKKIIEKKIINKATEKDGIKATIDSIRDTGIALIVNYSEETPKELKDKWFFQNLELEIKDDLGNVYKGDGGSGYGEKNSTKINCTSTFPKLNDKATKLIITPKMKLSNSGGAASADKDGNVTPIKITIDKDHPAYGEVVLDDIVVELEK